MEVADEFRRVVDGLFRVSRVGLERLFERLRADAHLLRGELGVVELRGEVEHGRVALGLHLGENLGDGLDDLGLLAGLGAERVKPGFEILLFVIEANHGMAGVCGFISVFRIQFQ